MITDQKSSNAPRAARNPIASNGRTTNPAVPQASRPTIDSQRRFSSLRIIQMVQTAAKATAGNTAVGLEVQQSPSTSPATNRRHPDRSDASVGINLSPNN